MRRTLASTAVLCALAIAGNARAQDAPTFGDAEKLALLKRYSIALGRRFGCDNESASMVREIKRLTYVLQFGSESTAAASSAAKIGLTSGMADVREKRYDCRDAEADVKRIDGEMRTHPEQMDEVAKTISRLTGAIMECNGNRAEAAALERDAAAYAGTEGIASPELHRRWQEQGRDEMRAKGTTCKRVTEIFTDVAAMYGTTIERK